MKTGRVKFFNQSKGFGFIIDDETGKDYFVHATGTDETIKDDDFVEFEIGQGKKGDMCINVKIKSL